jgi:metaxin
MAQQAPSKEPSASAHPPSNARQQATPQPASSIFAIPRPLKILFDTFPLHTYPSNTLPVRSPRRRDRHALYIFTTAKGAAIQAPSFNPSCLKWQAYLKFLGVNFDVISSSNHASPSGALPFLLPASNADNAANSPVPVTAGKLQKWALKESGKAKAIADEPTDARYDAYMSLLDHRIRRAWVCIMELND